MYICVDFDGTCVTHEYPKVGRDIGAAPVLKDLVDAGCKLILNTMRGSKSEGSIDDAIDWFNNRDIPLYGINNNPQQKLWTNSTKAYGEMYIDDAALGAPLFNNYEDRPFIDWISVRKMLVDQNIIKTRKPYKLFLDDERVPEDVYNFLSEEPYDNLSLGLKSEIYKEDWVIVRNYQDFVNMIEGYGLPTDISFDHDIADFDANGYERTGFTCVNWLANRVISGVNLKMPNIHVHSMNTVGRENIELFMVNFEKIFKNLH